MEKHAPEERMKAVRFCHPAHFTSFSINCMTYLYIIKCKNGVYYTGITSNLERRISEHNLGIRTYTQPSMRPVELMYSEKFQDRIMAARREKEIKGWSRKKKENMMSLHRA